MTPVLAADPARRSPLGLLGLSGTEVTYTVHLHATTDGSAVVGATGRERS